MPIDFRKSMTQITNWLAGNRLLTPEQTKCQSKQQVFFHDDFLKVAPGDYLKNLGIGYQPQDEYGLSFIQDRIPQHLLTSSESSYREHTRNRVIIGPVTYYHSETVTQEIGMVTGCGVNLMPTSPADVQKFATNGQRYTKDTHKHGKIQHKVGDHKENTYDLNEAAYTLEVNKLADLWIESTKNAGYEHLVMPAVGVGVYVNVLNSQGKQKAIDITIEAFASAAEKHALKVTWVCWDKERNPQLKQDGLEKILTRAATKLPQPKDRMFKFQTGAVQGIALTSTEKTAIFNAGSDRTIGGKFTHENPKTIEEQIAQQTDLLVQHGAFNTHLVAQFQTAYETRRAVLPLTLPASPAVMPATPAHYLAPVSKKIPLESLRKTVEETFPGCAAVISGNNIQLQIKKSSISPEILLKDYDIGSKTNPGRVKTVRNPGTETAHILLTSGDAAKIYNIVQKSEATGAKKAMSIEELKGMIRAVFPGSQLEQYKGKFRLYVNNSAVSPESLLHDFGITSTSNKGHSKTLQNEEGKGDYIILTSEDAAIIYNVLKKSTLAFTASPTMRPNHTLYAMLTELFPKCTISTLSGAFRLFVGSEESIPKVLKDTYGIGNTFKPTEYKVVYSNDCNAPYVDLTFQEADKIYDKAVENEAEKKTSQAPSAANSAASVGSKNKSGIVEKLKLDSSNTEHMTYWADKVKCGGAFYKGHTVPHTIKNILTAIDKEKAKDTSQTPSEAVFKQLIKDTVNKSSGSWSSFFGLSNFYRSKELRQVLVQLNKSATNESNDDIQALDSAPGKGYL